MDRLSRAAIRLLSIITLVCSASATTAYGVDAFAIVGASGGGVDANSLSITMDSDAPVQGFVLAVQYDDAILDINSVDVTGAPLAAQPELVVGEIYPASLGFTLGVILDAVAPFDGQSIPPGVSQEIAQFDVSTTSTAYGTIVQFDFVDGVLNDPPLDNIQVQAGFSVGAAQGLQLTGGTFELVEETLLEFSIGAATVDAGSCVGVPVRLSNSVPVQGYVLAIEHDASVVDLVDITIAGTTAAAAGAEFVAASTNPGGGSGGTLGVVLDFEPPFDGQTIAPGVDQPIAEFIYCCDALAPPGQVDTALEFVDGVLDTPPLDNVAVIGGLAASPTLLGGVLTCVAGELCLDCGELFCAGTEGFDSPAQGYAGEQTEVCFYYASSHNVQGFQLALCYDCALTFESFSVEDTILDAVGVEFVNYQVDSDPNDGDGCEFIVGILMDALPPFAGQTVPQTTGTDPLAIGCATVSIAADAECGTCLDVDFCNGINGAGGVAIENIFVIDFASVQGLLFHDCCVEVIPVPFFLRGDCNTDDKVDLADPASVLGIEFFTYVSDCDDGCDANDDGKINLADSVFLLQYLFNGGIEPPAPGAYDLGRDTTPDGLDCNTGVCL